MNYYNYKVTCEAELIEILMALFGEMPFEAYQELEAGFHAYLPESEFSDEVEVYLKDLKQSFDFSHVRVFVPYKNWNEEWEKNFEPVVVGNFCGIRADFHPPFENVEHELVINPKMAFGTGHHETTFMVVETMQQLELKDRKVLDFGCGTGILAILASRLGAKDIDAVDIEEESYFNTIENAARNEVTNISPYQGSLEVIESNGYDIILANINRNVILKYLPSLYSKLKKHGHLVVSGFIKEDEMLLVKEAAANHFQLRETKYKGNWICQLYQK